MMEEMMRQDFENIYPDIDLSNATLVEEKTENGRVTRKYEEIINIEELD